MSEITTVYSSIAAAAVPLTIGGVTANVTAYTPDKLPNFAETAILPCRLLLPVGASSRNGGTGSFIGDFGAMACMKWTLQDLCLLAPEAQGIGLLQYAPLLLAYMGSYHEMIRNIRVIPGTVAVASAVMTWQMTPQIIEWPQGGGRRYHAVSVVLTIDETT